MLFFENDYSEGAHIKILERFIETNNEKTTPYGSDVYTESAKEKIRKACANPEAEIYLLCGGTQTNKVVISSLLKPYEGIVSAVTGHINGHESGAIENSGHKVLTLPHHNGKLCADELDIYVNAFYADATHEHMVAPGMLYISHPTEYGTLYTKDELTALSEVCKKHALPLFLDGARLGYGLAADNDLTLADIAALCDVFYIGGTKVGALCGEAVVFKNKEILPKHFLSHIKQNGALFAKGRTVGVQFDTLFTDDLYMNISKNAIDKAERLKDAFAERGYSFFIDSPTNQIFVVLDNTRLAEITEKVRISVWEKPDDSHTVVRFATSWATTNEDIDALIALL